MKARIKENTWSECVTWGDGQPMSGTIIDIIHENESTCEVKLPNGESLTISYTSLERLPDDSPAANPVPTPLAGDPVNHPKHYTNHPSGVECITVTRHMGFNLGNATKYIWRADLKGNDIEDLEKAEFYIRDEIAKRKAAKQETHQ